LDIPLNLSVLLYFAAMKMDPRVFLSGCWKLHSFWPERAALDQFHDRRLRELVKHASQQVPHYRNLMRQAGIDPASFRGRCDLEKVPISRKADFQNCGPEGVLAAGVAANRLISHETGGSTGKPLTIYRSWGEERWLNWLRWRAARAIGWSPRDWQVNVCYLVPPESRPRNRLHEWTMAAGFFRQGRVSCYLPPRQMLEEIAALQPDILNGYPTTLSRMVLAEPELCRRMLRPRLICTGGEMLTKPVRLTLQEHFGVPIIDIYACHECNLLAWECPHSGYFHVCEEGVVLEVLDHNGKPVPPGGTGEVVCTALHSFAMPIIRYSLADLATWGPATCPCGNQLALLKTVRGRQLDYMHLPDGRWMHPYELIDLLFGPGLTWIAHYQLVQETTGELRMLIRPRNVPPLRELERLRILLSDRAGCSIEIIVVEDIPLGHNGKFRVAYSKLTELLPEGNS
jgi:phenylacetate-CoA ligase